MVTVTVASNGPNYYEILGVGPNAAPREIDRAFRRLARRYHPDVSTEADARARFEEIRAAYEVLRDRDRRARYDRSTVRVSVSRRQAGQRVPRPQPTVRRPQPTVPRPHPSVPQFLDDPVADPQVPIRAAIQVRVPAPSVLSWGWPRLLRLGLGLPPPDVPWLR
jgi:curved DNA-binding protein CbpA